MAAVYYQDGILVDTQLILDPNAVISGFKRSKLDQEALSDFVIPLAAWRVHDSLASLPTTPAADDLGFSGTTYGTDVGRIDTKDEASNAAATSSYMRHPNLALPYNYDGGNDIVLRFRAAMTTVADTTATIDCEAYLSDLEGAVSGTDLVTTSAQSINNTGFSNYDFVVNPSGRLPGDVLDVRVTITIEDGATGSGVVGRIGDTRLRCDTRG